ncbi:MAG: GDSL-type esterase/lipase family protein [Blautia sp.]|nr:GDSL-type esterase/lipase family protein [Blautia sp.]
MAHQKKRKRQQPGRFLNMLILIFIVLIVFEGNLLINIFRKDSLRSQVNSQIDEILADSKKEETELSAESETPAAVTPETNSVTPAAPANPAIAALQATPVDDSYFADAVFIGDSRMEGFRNQSGITQGTFLTGVGMDVINIFEKPYIYMYNEYITVYQALINTHYKKVYVMLGTNDLGEPDFNDFKENYRVCLGEIKKLAPDAIIYVISVAYVEEAKVEDSTYVNNRNIDAVNEKILELCESEGYYYVDINEVLSNGNHSLTEGATSDGVHMYDSYCKIWLEYLKNHYVPENDIPRPSGTESSPESETQSETSSETAL